MPEASPGILVRIRNGNLVADRVLLQELEGVAHTDVVVRFCQYSWPVKIWPQHDEQIGAGTGIVWRRLNLRPAERSANQYKRSYHNCSDDLRMTSHGGSSASGEVPFAFPP